MILKHICELITLMKHGHEHETQIRYDMDMTQSYFKNPGHNAAKINLLKCSFLKNIYHFYTKRKSKQMN